MEKLMRASFLLGLVIKPQEIKNLTPEERVAILGLVEKEYGINKSELMSSNRELNNTRCWNHAFEGGY